MSETAPGEPMLQPSRPPRPGTIVGAAVVTWATVAVVLGGTLAVLVFMLWFGGLLLDSLEGSRRFLFESTAVVAAWSLGACALAWWPMQGRNWARIVLAVSALAVVVVSALTVAMGFPAIPLAGGLSVLVLLFVGGANEWYRSMSGARDDETLRRGQS